MNVVFMGTPEFACKPLEALANSPHNLLAVVTVPDKPSGRAKSNSGRWI
jgi:methionyl-tRNA formyltransferase